MSVAHALIIFLLVVLITSGCSKLFNRHSFRQTLEGLGLPPALASFGMWAVPLFEIVVALLFLPQATRGLAEIGLGLLVLSFVWSVYRALSQKLSLSCNCFGNLADEQFGKLTIFRILVLAVIDGYLLFVPSDSLTQVTLGEWVAASLLSVGCLMIYAVATTFYDQKQAWKKATVTRT
jgi:uncharacterized membrane protein YphA (DoxX/SURF4 family)